MILLGGNPLTAPEASARDQEQGGGVLFVTHEWRNYKYSQSLSQ